MVVVRTGGRAWSGSDVVVVEVVVLDVVVAWLGTVVVDGRGATTW